MRVADQPGVLADITRILAEHDISIDAMVQREPARGRETQVDIIMLTHDTRRRTHERGDRADRGAADGARRRSCRIRKEALKLELGRR